MLTEGASDLDVPTEVPAMPEGFCNKCGEHRELVLAGCVCGSCADALDRQWSCANAIDWVLIATQGPMHPPLRPFVRRYLYPSITYGEMKSLWAKWSNPRNTHYTGLITLEEMAQMRSALGEVAFRSGTPFIRPATVAEVANQVESLQSRKAYEETTRIFLKWQFDPLGRPLGEMESDGVRRRRELAIE